MSWPLTANPLTARALAPEGRCGPSSASAVSAMDRPRSVPRRPALDGCTVPCRSLTLDGAGPSDVLDSRDHCPCPCSSLSCRATRPAVSTVPATGPGVSDRAVYRPARRPHHHAALAAASTRDRRSEPGRALTFSRQSRGVQGRTYTASAMDTRPAYGGHRGRDRTPGWTVLRTSADGSALVLPHAEQPGRMRIAWHPVARPCGPCGHRPSRGVRAVDTCGLRNGHPATTLDTCLDTPLGHPAAMGVQPVQVVTTRVDGL
jgi:hypothetical protein